MKLSILDTVIEIYIILGYLCKDTYTSSGSGGILKSDQKHRTQKAAEKANELYCYKCHTMNISENYCMNVTKENTDLHAKCEEDRRICMVKKISFMSTGENATVGHKTWSLERSCTQRCDPGCIVIGERLKLRKCVSCCDENLCNSDNAASRVVTNGFPIFILLRFAINIF